MIGYGFILNPNLTVTQVSAMVEAKAAHQRKMAEQILASVEAGLATLPLEARADFVSRMASLYCMVAA